MYVSAKFAAAHKSFAAQGLQKLLSNYNLASRVLQMRKAAAAAAATQSCKRTITAFRLCVANSPSISSSWVSGRIRLSFDYSRSLLASATHRTSDQSRLVGLGERIFHLTRCYSTSSSPEPCPSRTAGTTTLESARPSTRVTVREVWEQSASPSCPTQHWSPDHPPDPPPPLQKWLPVKRLTSRSSCSSIKWKSLIILITGQMLPQRDMLRRPCWPLQFTMPSR